MRGISVRTRRGEILLSPHSGKTVRREKGSISARIQPRYYNNLGLLVIQAVRNQVLLVNQYTEFWQNRENKEKESLPIEDTLTHLATTC